MHGRNLWLSGLAVIALVLSAATPLLASNAVAPEIDGRSLSAGLAAVAAGVLVVRARWGSK
jgi:hypothetical protein